MNKWTIQNDQRGLLFKKGSYVRLLTPGDYRFLPWAGYSVEVLELAMPFQVPGKDLELFIHDSRLLEELVIVDVQDDEYVLHNEDGHCKSILMSSGKYAFWRGLKQHTFVHFDIRQPELPAKLSAAALKKLTGLYTTHEVADQEIGYLFYDNVQQRKLGPGKYRFWKGPVSTSVQTIDTRRQQLDLIGQEMMTEDKVTLRLNFVCQYKVTNPLKALEIKGFEDQLYIQLQLVLREYVGTLKLDELLRTKQEIGTFVLERMQQRSEEYGTEFCSAGVKDIILPGEVRDIMNTVLLAEKKAQANLITRREETASTRSLLNTAKLMDENATLFRLKELEFLEKISDNVGSVSLTGGGNLLEQLNQLLAGGRQAKPIE
ncbi:slipin family protein [Paenibacillus radicis (ex Gao et al. 2016)]|uniref:Peptidase n=1 Tax=Paenibacillus radicis (ex Gao et al. 2016) TaxID=1737354 RepID=A0A917H178_9BACL|nr:slipin family protein [Paenibacillus radicis (ex Gao et al. 2016)]GGG63579.1 peptidase [Paenibacillus radicis (ex Gao et al. 2016)]